MSDPVLEALHSVQRTVLDALNGRYATGASCHEDHAVALLETVQTLGWTIGQVVRLGPRALDPVEVLRRWPGDTLSAAQHRQAAELLELRIAARSAA